jgi:PhnB protein
MSTLVGRDDEQAAVERAVARLGHNGFRNRCRVVAQRFLSGHSCAHCRARRVVVASTVHRQPAGGTMAKVDAIPQNYPRVTPYLSVDDGAAAIAFYCDILGATDRGRMAGPDGKVAHAELELGGAVIMLSDAFDVGPPTPKALGGTPVTLMVYVEDVDAVHARALAAGATEVAPVTDQFYGDRSGQFDDPFGHRWNIATHVEDVPPEEMEQRAAAAMSG